jgi:hypothetical protein
VRLCSRWDLSIHARAFFRGSDEPLVRLRAGGLTFALEYHEAQRLARELLEAIERIDDVRVLEGGQP